MRMNTGCGSLSAARLRPLQRRVLIVFSPAFNAETVPDGSGPQLPSGVQRSSWGRLFIPVLRENQAPKPGGGTLGLHGL